MNVPPDHGALRARGALFNPPGRFDRLHIDWEPQDEYGYELNPALRTAFLRDDTQSIISYNDSPDMSFDAGLNPYRGCEHGCSYCFARPGHEYLGMSAGLDFESKIMVKMQAPDLLRRELSKKSWKRLALAMSGVTDCYQPVERRLKLTRACLEVLAEFRNPVGLITKNHLITRDLDVLQKLAHYSCVVANISVTTLDAGLAKILEPRASPPHLRLRAIEELHAAGIPVKVMMAPVIPGLTDHEMPELLRAAARAGACDAGYVALRLPGAVAPLFEAWLSHHMPGSKDKVLGRLREMHGGKIYDATWGKRMRGEGFFADQMKALFELSKRRAGFKGPGPVLSKAAFRVPDAQLHLGLDLANGEA